MSLLARRAHRYETETQYAEFGDDSEQMRLVDHRAAENEPLLHLLQMQAAERFTAVLR
jgi:hypothetical protein